MQVDQLFMLEVVEESTLNDRSPVLLPTAVPLDMSLVRRSLPRDGGSTNTQKGMKSSVRSECNT